MPALSVKKNQLFRMLNRYFTNDEFNDLIFDFGVELDDIYYEDGEEMFKFDIAANRYDLLCIEGFAAAINSYLGNEYPELVISSEINYTVKQEETHERKFIACAIIKNINMNEKYESFIDYQDKLHMTICRNRTLAAIGTHDLDKIQGEIKYKTVDTFTKFSPLKSTLLNSNNSDYSIEDYKNNCIKKISKYFDILSENNKCVVFESNGNIMSVPPIVNSETTKISKNTKNVFVEVTGTDFNKVNSVLKLMLYSFRGESIEKVKIIKNNCTNDCLNEIITPVFELNTYSLNLTEINKNFGLNLTHKDIKKLLEKMIYNVSFQNQNILATPKGIRMDVMHKCDVIEDLAISYGFNNFEKISPKVPTIGSENLLNKFTDKIRNEIALGGFNEALTLTLLSKQENLLFNNIIFKNDDLLNKNLEVVLSNPKSKEYEVVRTSLLPGLLKTISSNLKSKIPIKVFEVADVVHNINNRGINKRYASAILAANSAMLEDVQGPLSLLLSKCGLKFEYILNNSENNQIYLKNQNAIVKVENVIVGSVGVLHPNISKLFKIPYAMSAFEIDLEEVYKIYINKLS